MLLSIIVLANGMYALYTHATLYCLAQYHWPFPEQPLSQVVVSMAFASNVQAQFEQKMGRTSRL